MCLCLICRLGDEQCCILRLSGPLKQQYAQVDLLNLLLSIASSWNLFIVDESLKIAAEAWSESQNRKLFLWHKQLTTKVKICIVVA